jgi:hypothetical protein
MPTTLHNAARTKEVQGLDRVRFTPAKAQYDSPGQSTRSTLVDRLAAVKKAALLSVHGSGKAAALEIGCDQSQMNRQLQMGTFDTRQEAAAGAAYLVKLGELLIAEFGDVTKTRQRLVRERAIGALLDLMEAL